MSSRSGSSRSIAFRLFWRAPRTVIAPFDGGRWWGGVASISRIIAHRRGGAPRTWVSSPRHAPPFRKPELGSSPSVRSWNASERRPPAASGPSSTSSPMPKRPRRLSPSGCVSTTSRSSCSTCRRAGKGSAGSAAFRDVRRSSRRRSTSRSGTAGRPAALDCTRCGGCRARGRATRRAGQRSSRTSRAGVILASAEAGRLPPRGGAQSPRQPGLPPQPPGRRARSRRRRRCTQRQGAVRPLPYPARGGRGGGEAAPLPRRIPESNVGHIQIAGPPERLEPDRGELNYDWLLPLIDELGYDGWVGCEYRPAAGTEAGLGWARRWGIRPPPPDAG